MQKLTDNEKRLLMILGAGLFLVANILGYFLFSDVMKNTKRQEDELRKRIAKLEEAKANVATADQLQQWMLDHLKESPTDEDRENHLDLVVGKLIADLSDLELSKNAPMSTVIGQHFIRSRYRTNVKGPWPQVKEFIYRLQSPEDFRLVTSLSMVPKKSEEDDSVQLVEVTVMIEKFWPQTEGAINAADVLANNEQPAAESVQPPATDSVAAAPAPATPDPAGTPPAPAPVPADSPTPPAPAPAPPPANPDASAPIPPTDVSVPNPPADNSTKPTL